MAGWVGEVGEGGWGGWVSFANSLLRNGIPFCASKAVEHVSGANRDSERNH